jgi:predicted transcriptional regulator
MDTIDYMRQLNEELIKRIKDLRKKGFGPRRISKILGLPRSTVSYYIYPELREKSNQKRKELYNKKKLEIIEERKNEIENILELLKKRKYQKKKLSEEEKFARVAGIFLGEGCSSMTYNGRRCELSIGNKDGWIIEISKKILGGNIYIQRKSGFSKTPIYILRISRKKEVLNALLKLYPYLVGRKMKLAKLMIEFLSIDLALRGLKPTTKEEMEMKKKCLEIYEKFRKLSGKDYTSPYSRAYLFKKSK